MKQHDIDSLFASKLNNQEIVFNPVHWEAAKELIKEREKKKYLFFWLISSIGLGLIIMPFFFLKNFDTSSQDFGNSTPSQYTAGVDTPESKDNTSLQRPSEPETNSKLNKSSTKGNPNNSNISSLNYSNSKTKIDFPKRGNKTQIVSKEDEGHQIRLNQKQDILTFSNESNKANATDIIERRLLVLTPRVPLFNIFPINKTDIPQFLDFEKSIAGIDAKINRSKEITIASNISGLGGRKYDLFHSANSRVELSFPFGPKLSVGSGLGYSLRFNANVFTKISEEIIYGFSSISKTYGLKTKQIHYLNIPLFANYDIGIGNIQIGMDMDFVIGANGNLEIISLNPDPLNPPGVTVRETLEELEYGWLDSDPLKNPNLTFWLGYNYPVSRRFEIGVKALYHSTTPDYFVPENFVQDLGPDLFWGLRFGYKL